MKKLISFSLWGDSKLYCQGAIDNIALAKLYYPDWICRFYVAENCPALPVLQQMDCEVIVKEAAQTVDRSQDTLKWHNQADNICMMWRFFAAEDPEVERVIFRDTDSRLSAREAQAVKEWEQSGMLAHRIHECKEHWNAQMMGGMWGVRGGTLQYLNINLNHYLNNFFGTIRKEPLIFVDLWFIMDVLWPYIKDDCLGHGFGHPNPLTVDGPMVGSCTHEEWRYEKFN